MESMVKKYQQRFRKVEEEMGKWQTLQSSLLSQLRIASSIINRLQVVRDSNNYGTLVDVDGIVDAVLRKQMDSLNTILLSMNKTLEEFFAIVLFLERLQKDGRQLVKGGSSQLTTKQLQQRVGVMPCLADCLDGLSILHDMHRSEYFLKTSVVSALPSLVLKPSPSNLAALLQLLVDQPNIPKEEVQLIFDIIFAKDIC